MSTRIKDFLYDFLKDKHVAIYHIQSKDLHNYYKKYCAEKSFSNVEVENIMSFGSTLGWCRIAGASRKNKSWPGVVGSRATWTFHVATVKTALGPTNMSSTSVTSTMTSSGASTTVPIITTNASPIAAPIMTSTPIGPNTPTPTARTTTATLVSTTTPVVATSVNRVEINIMDDDESEPKFKKPKTEPSARLKNLEDCKQYITQDEYDRKKDEILATI